MDGLLGIWRFGDSAS